MKKFPAVLLCGLAVMLLTIVLYFTILGNVLFTAIHFIAIVAILLAEAITTAYAHVAVGKPRRVAAAVISGLMIPFSAILSVVYVINFPTGYATYIGWYCAGTVVVNVIAFVLLHFDSRKNEEDDCLQESKNHILDLRKLVMSILADPAAQVYAKQLRALEEKLHFSNDSVIVDEDENIRFLLLQLQENIADPEFDSLQMFEKIEKAINIRNIMTSRNV